MSAHRVTGDVAYVSLSTPYCWQADIVGDFTPDCPSNGISSYKLYFHQMCCVWHICYQSLLEKSSSIFHMICVSVLVAKTTLINTRLGDALLARQWTCDSQVTV